MRYFWTILDALSNKIFAFLNLTVIGLLVALLSYGENPSSQRQFVIKAVIFLLASLFFVLALAYVVRLILFLTLSFSSNVLGKRCDYVWEFVGNEGTLATDVYFKLRNFSVKPNRTFFNDSEGFCVKHNYRPSYSFLRRTVGTAAEIRIVGEENAVGFTEYQDYATGKSIYQAQWAVSVEPPLHPFETIELVRRSVDERVEAQAFEASGTEFVFRCKTHFQKVTASVIAPPGHRFEDVQTGASDQAGKSVSKSFLSRLLRTAGVKTITWEIPYPGVAKRYRLKFRLVPL